MRKLDDVTYSIGCCIYIGGCSIYDECYQYIFCVSVIYIALFTLNIWTDMPKQTAHLDQKKQFDQGLHCLLFASTCVTFRLYQVALFRNVNRQLAIFDLQVTSMTLTKFKISLLFGSGEEMKNIFSRWRPPWISDRYNFSYF